MLDRKQYYRQLQEQRRAEAIAYLGGQCVVCGALDRLQFDHIDPATKEFTIAPRLRISWVKLVVELSKCQLLCVACHDDKTHEEATNRIPWNVGRQADHGTPVRYFYHGCRCDDCRKAGTEYRTRFVRVSSRCT